MDDLFPSGQGCAPRDPACEELRSSRCLLCDHLTRHSGNFLQEPPSGPSTLGLGLQPLTRERTVHVETHF